MHRIVALILLALLPLQGTLPGQAMACATDAQSMTNTGGDAAPQAHEHDHARAAEVDATAENRASSPKHDAPRSDGNGHCLTSACIAPALAASAATHDRAGPPTGGPSKTVVAVLHSAAPAPDTPPPRG